MRRGVEQGFDQDVVRRAAHESERLKGAGLEPVLTLGHLAHLTGAPHGYLRLITSRSRDPYTDVAHRKRSGGVRPISVPEAPLMKVQRWMLRRVLTSLEPHPASHAYQQNRSILTSAGQHVGAQWLVKLDLHNFFGTVTENRVYKVFLTMGYSPLVSLELARLSTRSELHDPESDSVAHKYNGIPDYGVRSSGVLPQGAPTSGALANAVAKRLDEQLADLAYTAGMAYTRYSDDLTFSTSGDFDRKQAARIIQGVTGVVSRQRFTVHRKKTQVVPPGSRKVVLGLLLRDDRVALLPEFKRRIETHTRGVQNFGLANHVAHRGFRSIISFVNYVEGCLAFAAGVEPDFSVGAKAKWEAALSNGHFLV